MSKTASTTLPRRNRLLSSCAVAVIATLTVHMPVRAQALPDIDRGFQGTGNPLNGGAFIRPVVTGSKNTTIEINAPRAIINWTPTDNGPGTAPIDFLPNGHSANFINGETGNFIVLNRIIPADNRRAIELNGTITSRVNGGVGGGVWFYSPGGILVGSQSIINVGSLLLTTSNIADDDFMDGDARFTFGRTSTGEIENALPHSRIEIRGDAESRAQISALSRNSYVALIAPRIAQSGNVTVNGSAAYVAAEAATMTIANSLFNIEVTAGSAFDGSSREDAALVHEGTTTIDNSEVGYGDVGYGTTATQRHAIMVAVPKNDAVTMLVQGSVEYTAAAKATVVDNRIILSAGHDVANGAIGAKSAAPGTGTADIAVSNAVGRSAFGANVVGKATGTAGAVAIARNEAETGYGGTVTPLDDLAFAGSLSLQGALGASLEAGAGSRVDIAGTLTLDAAGSDAASTARASLIARSGSDIDIGGSARIDASFRASGGGDAVSGRTAEMIAEGGSISIGGGADLNAVADGDSQDGDGVNVEGGTASVIASGGGGIEIAGSLFVDASASGGSGSGLGGDGKGGTAMVESRSGSLIRTGGGMFIYSFGEGGFGGTAKAGNGLGGVASILAAGGEIEAGGTLSLEATGFGGISFDGDIGYGDGGGGSATLGITVLGTDVGRISAGNIVMDASGVGGGSFGGPVLLAAGEQSLQAGSGFAAASAQAGGGSGSGGSVTAVIDGTLGTSSLSLSADGVGGNGNDSFGDAAAQAGGDGIGGTILVEFRSGTTALDSLFASASGSGGDGGDNFDGDGDGGAGGAGDAGGISILATGGSATIGDLSIGLIGAGGDGGSSFLGGEGAGGGDGGKGGVGQGGDLILSATGSGSLAVTSGAYDVSAFGGSGGDGAGSDESSGGAGGAGGEAFGGTIRVAAADGGSLRIAPPDDGYGTTFFTPLFRAEATGGRGGAGGFGVDGGAGGAGGAGTGGGIAFDVMGGTLDFTPPGVSDPILTLLSLLALGYGGDGGDGGDGDLETGIAGDGGRGGMGVGGTTSVAVADGTLTVGELELVSAGHGGSGGRGGEADEGGDGGRGGDAHGGGASFSLTGAVTFNQFGRGIELQAYGLAGDGGDGGDGGTGASAGGISGAGGDGIGGGGIGPEGAIPGGIAINLNADNVEIARITARAKGDGGSGGSGFFGGEGGIEQGYGVAAAGGAGGSGAGGTITLASNRGVNNIQQRIKFSANGEGGQGGSSQSLAGGAGGKGAGGTIRLEATGTGNLRTEGALVNAYGLGGSGNSGGEKERGGNGGRGGDASGGTVELATSQKGKLNTGGSEGGGTLQANAYAVAGHGGSGGDGTLFDPDNSGGRGGNGGDATGGTVNLAVNGGELILGDATLDVNGRGGDGAIGGIGAGREEIADNPDTPEDESEPAIPATQAPVGSGGGAIGGTIRVEVADHEGGDVGSLRAGSLDLFASGFGGFNSDGESFVFGSAGTIGIFESARFEPTAEEAGSFSVGSIFAEAYGFGDVNPVGFQLVTDTGRIEVFDTVDVFVDADASFTGIGNGQLSVGNSFNVTANGSITLAQDPEPEVFLIGARNIRLSAAGSINGGSAGIFAFNDIRADAGGDVGLGVVEAGDDIFVTGGSATIGLAKTNGEEDEEDGGEGGDNEQFASNLVVETAGTIFVAEADVADEIRLTSSFGNVESNVALAAGGEIEIQAATDVVLADATAGDDVDIFAFGNVSSTGTLEAGDDIFVNAGGNISLTNAVADDRISLRGADVALTGEGRASNRISVFGNTVSLGDLFTTNPEFGGEAGSTGIEVFADGESSIRSADSASTILVRAGGFSSGPMKAGAFIDVSTFGGEGGSGAIDIASADAGSFIRLRGDTTIGAGSLTAGTDIDAETGGTVTIGSADAGDDVLVTSTGGAVTVASASALGSPDTESGYGANAGANIRIEAADDARLDNGTTPGAITLASAEGSVLSAGTLRANRLTTTQAANIALTDVIVTQGLLLQTNAGSIGGRSFTSDGSITLDASGDINLAAAQAGGDFIADSNRNGTYGTITGAALIDINAGSNLTIDSVSAGGVLDLNAGLNTTIGSASGVGLVDINAGDTLTITSVSSDGDIELNARFDTNVGTVDASGYADMNAGEDISVGSATTGAHLLVSARNNGSVGAANAGARIEIDVGDSLDIGTVTAGGSAEFFASRGTFAAESIRAGSGVEFSSGGTATVGSILAGGAIFGRAGQNGAGDLSIAAAEAAGSIDLFAADDIALDLAGASGDIFAQGRNISFGDVTAIRSPLGGEGGGNGNIIAFGNGAVSFGTADAEGYIEVSGTEFSGGDLAAGEFVRIQADSEGGGAGTIALAGASAGEFIGLFGTGGVEAGTLAAGSDIAISGSAITLADGTAGRDILLDSAGAISVSAAKAGDDFVASGASFVGGTIVTTGLGEDVTEDGYGTGPGDGSNILVETAGSIRIDNGDAPDLIRLIANNGRIDSAGLIRTTQFDASATGDIALTDVDVANSLFLSASGGSVSGRNFTSDGDIELSARDRIAVASADAGGRIGLQADEIDVGAARAVHSIFASGSMVDLDSAVTTSAFSGEGGSGITVFASGDIAIGSADSATFLFAEGTNVSGGDLKAADQVELRAFGGEGGDGGNIDIASAAAGTFVELIAGGGSLAADMVTAGTDIFGSAGLDADIGSASAGGTFALAAGGAATAAIVMAGGDISIDAGSIALASGTAGRDILLDAAGAISVAAAQAGDDFKATSSGGGFTGGTITTTGLGEDATETGYGQGTGDGSNILVDAAGSIRLDNGNAPGRIGLTARNGRIDSAGLIETTQFDAGATSDIALTDVEVVNDLTLSTSGGSISGRTLASRGDVKLDANGNVTVQEARAGDDVSILAGGTALVGAAIATGTGADSEGDGFNISVEAAGTVSFGSADTVGNLRLVSQQGGILRLGAPDASLIEAGGDVFVSSAFDLNLSAVNAGGSISLASQGAIDTGSLAAGGDMALDAGAALSVDAAKAGGGLLAQGMSIEFGSVEIGGALSLGTPGALVLGTATAGSISGSGSIVTAATLTTPGAIMLTASGATSVGTAIAGSDIVLSGNGVTLTDGTAGREIRLASAGDIGVGSAKAGDDFQAEAGGAFTGTIVITTGQGPDGEGGSGEGTVALAANDGSNISVTAAGAIAIATGTAADTIDLSSSQASIASSTALTAGGSLLGTAGTTITLADAKAGQSIDLSSGGDLTAARIDAGGGVTLASSAGAVLVWQDLKSGQPVDASGRSVTLNAQGALAVRSATASAGNVALTSAGNLQIERADATSAVSANSGGTLGLAGQVNGTQISLASRDIAIGSNAQVGTTQRTSAIQITANGGNSPVVIGGSASGSGYRLDNTEFARLASRDVTVSSQGEASSMQIDALTVRGAGASNPNVTGRLSFAAGGDVEMTGRLAFDTATEANSVRVSAGRNFFADAGGAGIAITNGSALAGSIDIDARSITVASRAAATELGSLNNIDDRSDRLGRNDGAAPDNGGFLRAGGIRLSASERIYVQNSGANSDEPNDRAGLSAGAGGITLVTNSRTTPVEIIINGRQLNPVGGEFTGEALIAELTIVGIDGGPANFASRSTVNGCLILGFNCGVVVLPESPLTFAKDVIQELEEEDEEEGENSNQPTEVGFNRLIEMEGSPFVPVIDEPVTGSGNEDLSVGAFGGFTQEELNRQSDVGQPVTGTGNEQLQSGPAPLIQLPPPQPQGQQPDVNGPVTGTGNDTLQSDPPRED